jgi:hypothetical protein
MTLRDKFENIQFAIPANESVKIADDYAIEFKKWCDKNKSIIHTDEELLEIFKKETGL